MGGTRIEYQPARRSPRVCRYVQASYDRGRARRSTQRRPERGEGGVSRDVNLTLRSPESSGEAGRPARFSRPRTRRSRYVFRLVPEAKGSGTVGTGRRGRKRGIGGCNLMARKSAVRWIRTTHDGSEDVDVLRECCCLGVAAFFGDIVLRWVKYSLMCCSEEN